MIKLPAIILSAAFLTLGAASIPSIASAFDATQPAGASTTAQVTTPSTAPVRGPHGFAALNLNDAQKAQLKSIEDATHAKITAALTPDQQTQLNAALAANSGSASNTAPAGATPRHHGNAFKRALRSLNLSDAQRLTIRAIEKDQHAQMLAVLTPDQQAQLKSMMSKRSPAGAQQKI